MVGQSGYDPSTTDWLNKATPDQLVAQGRAVFTKIASMDHTTQDRFIQELRNDPQSQRLFEKIGQATA